MKTECAGAEIPARVADIDWSRWVPTERATLLFVIRDGNILLIEKKTGLGAGKINGPGGRIEEGETPLECALREVEEEVCVTPLDATPAGELRFQFRDGYALHGYVFRAEDCRGEARATREATPRWEPLDRLPFERMWPDDPLWFPYLLARQPFEGRFIFDGDRMLDAVVTGTEDGSAGGA